MTKKIGCFLAKKVVPWINLLAILSAAFFALMLAAYAIPQSAIEKNAKASIDALATGEMWPHYATSKSGVSMDYKTDQRMFEYALAEDGDSVFRAAQVPSYARYWHGYQAYLRPLLVFMSLTSMRGLNAFFLFAMVGLLMGLIAKRLNTVFAVCFGASLAMAGFQIVPLSFQFSSVFFVMLIASVLLLLLYDKPWFRARIGMFFFCVGAVTVFLDLLTAPIVSLGVPLILLLLLQMRDQTDPLKSSLHIVTKSVAWGAGYVSLWFSKWLIASVALGRNEIRISIEQIFFRTGTSAQGYINIDAGETASLQTWGDFASLNRFDALGLAFSTWLNDEHVPIFVTALVLLCFAALWSKYARDAIPNALILLVTALIPMAWLVLLGQHTAFHFYFSYRNLLVAGFALFSVPAYLWLQAWRGRLKRTPTFSEEKSTFSEEKVAKRL
ncbi:MAG: hypothetical protein LBB67_01380 [Oscillospiraceae bacterium]|jgi:hypothetical protein|nr:hypothetical protein [Oscillospiraceae bacterium]